MSIKDVLKSAISEKYLRWLYGILELVPDKHMLKFLYYANTGRKLNLDCPKRFTEKLQWYKLNYRNPLMTVCADKYKMREYVTNKGYADNLVKLYQVVDSFDEIDFNKLPNSFAIKSNNGSGTNVFITDKKDIDYKEVKRVVKSWKKVNTISVGREWAYKNIVPKILVEELLTPKDDFQMKRGINDYKVLCFNGEPKYVWVDVGRFNDFKRGFYDLNWNKLNVISNRKFLNESINKPEGYDKMIEIAAMFAKDFPFVRVDFYYVNNKVYIGELTFYPWSGCVNFTPDEFDYELGELFNIP